MARNVSKQDESFREYALNAAPVRVLLSVCAPLALYQALQQISRSEMHFHWQTSL